MRAETARSAIPEIDLDADATMPGAREETALITVDDGMPEALATCRFCGRPFRLAGRARNRRVYCSARCRSAIWQAAHPRVKIPSAAKPRKPSPPGSRISPTRAERARWRAAAESRGLTLSDFVRAAVNASALVQ